MRLVLIFLFFIMQSANSFGVQDSSHKFRVALSSPPGTTLSGFNRVFFLSCKNEASFDSYSDREEIKYIKSSDSLTGAISYDIYTRGIEVDIELLDCDKPLINQRVHLKVKAHYLKSMKSRLVRPAPAGGPPHHQDFTKPKSLTKYTPKIKRVIFKDTVRIDTQGVPHTVVTIADTQFSLSVKRF